MKKYYETKIYKIIKTVFDSRMELAVFSYILQNGTDNLKDITEDQISLINVRFVVPLNVTCGLGFLLDENKTKDTLCKVVERFNREVKNNYKIMVVPVEPNKEIASSRDYYTESMISLIKEGYIKIVA